MERRGDGTNGTTTEPHTTTYDEGSETTYNDDLRRGNKRIATAIVRRNDEERRW